MFIVNWKSREAKLSQWTGSTAGGTGSVPGQGTKIRHASVQKKEIGENHL